MPISVNREEKKAKIVDAAIEVFAAHGYNRTKIIDIARAADIGKGTVYEYFDSKHELFKEVFLKHKEFVLSEYWQVLDSTDNSVEKLQQVAVTTAALCKADEFNISLFQVFKSAFADSSWKGERLNLEEIFEELRALVETIIKEGIVNGDIRQGDPEVEARVFIAALDGLISTYIISPEGYDVDANAQAISDIFINGIGSTG